MNNDKKHNEEGNKELLTIEEWECLRIGQFWSVSGYEWRGGALAV